MAIQSLAAAPGVRRLIANAGFLAVGGVVAQAAFMFIEAMVARKLGVQAYGTFSAVYTITLLMVLANDMGMNWKLIEEGSREPSTMGVNLGTMICLKLLIFAAIYPLSLGLLMVAGYSPAMYHLFAIMALFGLLMTMQDSLAAVYTASHRNWFNAVFQTAVPVVTFLAVVSVVYPAPSLNRTGAAYVLGSAIPTMVWLWLASRDVAPTVDASRFKATLKGSYLYGVTSLLSYGSFKSGVLLLAMLASSRQVALFASAFKLVELGYKIPILANRLVAPYLFAGSKHQPEKFPSLCNALLRAAGVVSALTSAIIFIAGGEVIRLIFGAAFADAATLLQILGISLALKTFCLIAQAIVTAADRLDFRTRAVGIAAGVSVLASIPMILVWEARGAAYGVLIGDLVLVGMLLSQLQRLLPSAQTWTLIGAPTMVTGAVLALLAALHLQVRYAILLGPLLLVGLLYLIGYMKPILQLLHKSAPAIR